MKVRHDKVFFLPSCLSSSLFYIFHVCLVSLAPAEQTYFGKPWDILAEWAEMAKMNLQSLLISIPVNA